MWKFQTFGNRRKKKGITFMKTNMKKLNSLNISYHSIENILPLRFLPKNIETRICNN
jgi:hypothetical protein